MFDIAKKKAFVCDLDGTLFMGVNPIKSAVDFVIESTNSGRFRFFYLTNNTSKCPEEYMKKISGAAIPVVPEQILTPLITLESYIREKGYKSVYLISSEKVKAHMAERLADAGVSLDYDPERNELIALTYDKELTYDKLAKATGLWNMRNCPPSPMCPVRTQNQTPVDFVATHPDNCCPSERGPIPDIGGMMKFLEITNGMKPSHVFASPRPRSSRRCSRSSSRRKSPSSGTGSTRTRRSRTTRALTSCASFRARQRRKTLKTTGERRPQSSWRPSTRFNVRQAADGAAHNAMVKTHANSFLA